MTALLQPPAGPFTAEIAAVPAAVRARMEGVSWHGDEPRCPRWDELAYLRLAHVTFDGGEGEGELVVATALAARTVEVFRRLWQLGFPIRSLRLVDDFAASDDASMSADNSSAFNFRLIAGTQLLSQHALGRAIDINPVENPWRRPDRILPDEGRAFADRRVIRPGMIVRPGPVVAMFDELGWEWGGDWRHAFDDHHIVWSRAL
ncbi:MAG: M15 family metallopeptidase [Deltaproteobacteria bacterium]|nr:M15 family metallopeptidase [Deltaproteobacteria bacterium]